ncbi:hypothetical protein CKO12_04115 [Chromatium okenii]|nr:hypothetical protein [Chromatium okenii]
MLIANKSVLICDDIGISKGCASWVQEMPIHRGVVAPLQPPVLLSAAEDVRLSGGDGNEKS